jgi:hypothetical protein
LRPKIRSGASSSKAKNQGYQIRANPLANIAMFSSANPEAMEKTRSAAGASAFQPKRSHNARPAQKHAAKSVGMTSVARGSRTEAAAAGIAAIAASS